MFSISPLLKTESGSCRFELHWYDIPASSPTPPARNSQWPQDIRSSPHPFAASSCANALAFAFAFARCLRLSAVCLHVVEQ
jgi:hypothetical protein